MIFDFFIIGGDKRFFHMANFLAEKNFKVLTYGLSGRKLNRRVKNAFNLKFGIKNSKNVILPIPITKDFVFVLCENKKIHLVKILKYLKSENRLFGGCFPKKFVKICKEKNVFVYDYYKNKKFVIYNSLATAEAVVSKAILETSDIMRFSKCLVLGFGNCGKLICNKLQNFCSSVYVCTDDEVEKAVAKSYGFSVFGLDSLRFKIENFDFVFNTIPKKIFYEEILNNVKDNALVVDITKFGILADVERNPKFVFKTYPGMPGKFKFIFSARLLTNLTLKVINKDEKTK